VERAHERGVDTHHGAGVVELPAVVGRREERYQLSPGEELIAVLHHLQPHTDTPSVARPDRQTCRPRKSLMRKASKPWSSPGAIKNSRQAPWDADTEGEAPGQVTRANITHLVCTANQVEVVAFEEALHDILSESERHAPLILPPPNDLLVRIRPQQIAQEACVCYPNTRTATKRTLVSIRPSTSSPMRMMV
jgi:hypothetical protein